MTGPSILRLSAASVAALDARAHQLATQLRADGGVRLADVAFTLATVADDLAVPFRMCAVAYDAAGAAAVLESPDHALRARRRQPLARPGLVFMFPGQGAQYAGMGADLYLAEPVFRAACDEVFTALREQVPFDLRDRMFSGNSESLIATAVTQPAIFCLEYALAVLWRSRGVEPRAMIGHSVGEFVAAVLGGVMPLAAGARLVARRGAMINALPGGSMLSVRLAAASLRDRLPSTLSLAAENGPTACVVSGPTDDIAVFSARLEGEGVLCRVLQVSHAFHSAMVDPILAEFEAAVRAVPLSPPAIPIVSTKTGTWLTAAEATAPAYWASHLREPVRFAAGVQTLLGGEPVVFLEVGPRHSLSMLVQQQRSAWPGERTPPVVPTLADGPTSEREAFALAIGQLWLNGVDVAERGADRGVLLPAYVPADVPASDDADRTAPTTDGAAASSGEAVPASGLPRDGAESRAADTHAGEPAHTARHAVLVRRLRAVLEQVGGIDLTEADPGVSFVELGLDSLILTQAAIQLRKTFGVPVTFRQLMEQYRSLGAVATHLDDVLPPDDVPAMAATAEGAFEPVAAGVPLAADPGAAAPDVPAPHRAVAGDAPSSFAQQVIAQQLAIMARQLVLLGVAPTAPATEPLSPVPTAATPAAAPVLPVSAVTVPTEDEAATLRHSRYDVTKAFGAIARIHTQSGAELSERQQARLDAFIRSYTARTTRSKAYTERHRPHLADPRVVNGFRPRTKEVCYQIVVERSKGSHLWDVDGNEYVDALNGFGMSLFGWQPDFVNEAVKRQIDLGHEIGPQHPLAGEVAELVCELTGFDRAALCNTGSEAVMGAIRIARTVTARDLIVVFSGSYHGIFDEALVRGTRAKRAVPAAPGVLQAAVENVIVLDYGTPEALEVIRSRGHELAAVLVEPVQSRRPEFQPVEFLQALRRITEDQGTVLIFDEVITGFRSHPRGAQGLFGITADVATYGKVIGGGYPVGVIAGRRRFMDALDGGGWQYDDDSIPSVGVTYFAGTFVRHPLALAACKAALLHMREQGPLLQATLTRRTTAMAEEMNAFARSTGAPVEIRYFASLWRVAFTAEHPLQDLLWAMMRTRGIHILDNFPCFLTTAHSESDVGRIVTAFREALLEMIASGFLPGMAPAAAPVLDASAPPVPNARLGRDRDGSPAWFVPDPSVPGQYLKVTS